MTLNVIVADRSEEQAYELGYERFDAVDVDEDEIDLEGFRSGAEYANHVLPSLRALAGFEDSGYGTYQEGGEIAIVDEANLDDDPIQGASWTASDYLNVLVNRWHDGARDAIRGEEYGASL